MNSDSNTIQSNYDKKLISLRLRALAKLTIEEKEALRTMYTKPAQT
jgi:hypothetical protein